MTTSFCKIILHYLRPLDQPSRVSEVSRAESRQPSSRMSPSTFTSNVESTAERLILYAVASSCVARHREGTSKVCKILQLVYWSRRSVAQKPIKPDVGGLVHHLCS